MKKLFGPLPFPDNPEEALFEPTDEGYAYFPFGANGRGYIVTTDQKPRVQADARRAAWFFTNPQVSIFYYGLILVFSAAWVGLGSLTTAGLGGLAIFVSYLAIGFIYKRVLVNRSVKDLARSSKAFDSSRLGRMFDQALADQPRPKLARRYALYALTALIMIAPVLFDPRFMADSADRDLDVYIALSIALLLIALLLFVFLVLLDLIVVTVTSYIARRSTEKSKQV